jgi:PKD repeat protein
MRIYALIAVTLVLFSQSTTADKPNITPPRDGMVLDRPENGLEAPKITKSPLHVQIDRRLNQIILSNQNEFPIDLEILALDEYGYEISRGTPIIILPQEELTLSIKDVFGGIPTEVISSIKVISDISAIITEIDKISGVKSTIPQTAAQARDITVPINVPFFSQQSSVWGCNQLGQCTQPSSTCIDADKNIVNMQYSTIRRYGCFLTSKAMVFDYYVRYLPEYKDPGLLNTCLINNGGYTPGDCIMQWNNACVPSGVSFDKPYPATGYGSLSTLSPQIDVELSSGYPVLAGVRYNATDCTSSNLHMVVIVAKSGSTYLIKDPWDVNEPAQSRTLAAGALGPYTLCGIHMYHGSVPPDTCTDDVPNDSFSSASVISCGSTNQAKICSSTDTDYYKVTPSSSGTMTFTLTSPPDQDYDLVVYNGSETQLCSSANGVGVQESCSVSVTGGMTYYAQVIGYNGAYSSSEDYTLIVSCPSPATPTLSVDGGPSSTKSQGSTFTLTGSNYTPNGTVSRYINGGAISSVTATSSGTLPSWSWVTDCNTGTGTYTVYANDNTTGKNSNNINAIVTASSSCSPQTGSLTVTITPATAVNAGAMWSYDGGGAWQASGAVVSLAAGSYTVSYKTITGWTSPGNQTATIVNGQTASLIGPYVQQPQTGSLTVTITPQGAIDAGAQWNVDAGAWQSSGNTVSNLTVGSHTVSFRVISGWNAPGSQPVNIVNGQTASLIGPYVQQPQTGSLGVNIGPAAAVSAGAQWNVDGGNWQNSGATVGGLSVGSHTVNFNTITGWTSPPSQAVNIVSGQTTWAADLYVQQTQTGSLMVTIGPAAAVNAGAMWSYDGGAIWHANGTTVTLAAGSYTVSYKTISGWTSPASQNVNILNGGTTWVDKDYVQQPQTGSLTVTISPTAAVNTGAMWTCDGGGTWWASGATVSLAAGSYTVSFNTIAGWNTPVNQTATIANGQTASLAGIYTPFYAASLTASVTSGKAPLAVHFIYSSTGSVTKCLWNFGDGTTSKVRNPSHTYSKAGAYTVTLTVTGPWGTCTCTQPDYITVYAAPKANFSAAPASGKAPLQVNFTDESTGLITSWLWHFGDGTTSADESPDHTYNKAGTYTAKLTVTGPGGSNTKTLSIRATK